MLDRLRALCLSAAVRNWKCPQWKCGVHLWLQNVATLISVSNKRCAFKKSSHSHFSTSLSGLNYHFKFWLLWCQHKMVDRIILFYFCFKRSATFKMREIQEESEQHEGQCMKLGHITCRPIANHYSINILLLVQLNWWQYRTGKKIIIQ